MSSSLDHSPRGSSVHGILQARKLEWGAIPFPRGSSWKQRISQMMCWKSRGMNAFCLIIYWKIPWALKHRKLNRVVTVLWGCKFMHCNSFITMILKQLTWDRWQGKETALRSSRPMSASNIKRIHVTLAELPSFSICSVWEKIVNHLHKVPGTVSGKLEMFNKCCWCCYQAQVQLLATQANAWRTSAGGNRKAALFRRIVTWGDADSYPNTNFEDSTWPSKSLNGESFGKGVRVFLTFRCVQTFFWLVGS